MTEKCKTLIPSGSGCAICKSGFYRSGTECVACTAHCTSCSNIGCSRRDDTFWLDETSLERRPQSELTHCAVVTARGCERCDAGFFVAKQVRVWCNETTPG